MVLGRRMGRDHMTGRVCLRVSPGSVLVVSMAFAGVFLALFMSPTTTFADVTAILTSD